MFRDRRFRKLSDASKLTLFFLYASASDVSPEATWEDEEALVDSLIMLGRPREPLELILADLRQHGYLVRNGDGSFELPDWDAEQYAASRDIRLAWERHRAKVGRATTWRKKRHGEKSDHDENARELDQAADEATTK